MMDYNLAVSYIPGRNNELADCLSKMSVMKQWTGHYPMKGGYSIPSTQSSMKINSYYTMDDPILYNMLNEARKMKIIRR